MKTAVQTGPYAGNPFCKKGLPVILLSGILCANGAEVDLSGLLPETIKCVSIVAPSSQPVSNDVVECVRALEKAGKTVKVYPGVWHRSSNGADRAREIEAAWQDADTDLILCARGGSGSFDTLKALDFDVLRSRDVTFMGFSNISTLLNAFVTMGVKRPIGGPMASTLASYPHTAASIGRACAVLAKEDLPSSQLTVRRAPSGSIVGKPLGGHFPSLAGMTEEWIPDTTGRIIFLEVNSNYNYSRAVTSFDKMASLGWFEKAAAVVLCDMGINGTTAEKENLRVYITEAVTCPVFSGYTYGHVAGMLALDYDRNLTITPSGELLWENYSPESLVVDVPKGDVSNMTSLSCGTLKKTGDGTLALLSGRNKFHSTTTMLNVAHRGLWKESHLPQNTVEAIKAAYVAGAAVVETDFVETKSGEMICLHDRNALATMSTVVKEPAEITVADRAVINLGEKMGLPRPYRIPLLAEVLAVVPKDRMIQAEIKVYGPTYARQFDAAVRAAGFDFRVYGVNDESLLGYAAGLGATGFTCNYFKAAYGWAYHLGNVKLLPEL